MRQQSDAFAQLEQKVARFQSYINEINEDRGNWLPVALNGPTDEIQEAAAMRQYSDQIAKQHNSIKLACDDFLKHAVPLDSKEQYGNLNVNHYPRNVFDNKAWEFECQNDEDLKPLWESAQLLDAEKKKRKEHFQHIASSISITPVKEANNGSL